MTSAHIKIKSKTQQKVCLDKKSLETRNSFNVFETFSELEIDQMLPKNEKTLGVKSDTNGCKKKCKRCNFKTYCHLNLSECKASKGNCFACKKLNHVHQSSNCKKTKKRNHDMKIKVVSGCLRLRESLKLKPYNHKREFPISPGYFSMCSKCFKTNMFQKPNFCKRHHSNLQVHPIKNKYKFECHSSMEHIKCHISRIERERI